ncbi:ABC transporter permease [Phreatobacter aquaticus]|uniref:ABC transporter permease n=1 Tax=Phreatobacter aquaticus TaxID=2570229 RepID=A0A4D7QJN7_9HYPH|nr:ABC transporter permease [Phreatobacter aquaticus]QCK85526.1 ABC transporter permease [Phreatobacter aquaticus]
MRLILEKRETSPAWLSVASPVIAILLTLCAGAILFAVIGKNPVTALRVYFLDPLSDGWALQELAVKATPLILIGVGLTLCYRSNNWNIGAEGQLVMGAVFGSWVALSTHGVAHGAWVLPAMLGMGALGGALLALVPAILKARFQVNEILTSLMLVYVAELTLDYLVRGRWRDPKGFNFPQSVNFDPQATMPLLFGEGRLHVGFALAVLVALVAAFVLARTLKGFEIRLVGEAPRAARFAGFDDRRTTLFVFAVSGALAGLAGIIEVAGPIGQLQPSISPGYGFTAIIVAFLGRLNPIGALIAALFLALTFIGGENAQIALKIPLDVTRVFQGLLLFFVLGCDSFILYRLRLVSREGLA